MCLQGLLWGGNRSKGKQEKKGKHIPTRPPAVAQPWNPD